MTEQNGAKKFRVKVRKLFHKFYPVLILTFVISSLVFIGIYESKDMTHDQSKTEGRDRLEREGDNEEWGNNYDLPSPLRYDPRLGRIAEEILEGCGSREQRLPEVTPEVFNRCTDSFFGNNGNNNVFKIFDVNSQRFLPDLNHVHCDSDGCNLISDEGRKYLLYERDANFDCQRESPTTLEDVARYLKCLTKHMLRNEDPRLTPSTLNDVGVVKEQVFLEKREDLLSQLRERLREFRAGGLVDNFEIKDGLSSFEVRITGSGSSIGFDVSPNDSFVFRSFSDEEQAIRETLKGDVLTLLGLELEEKTILQILKEELKLLGFYAFQRIGSEVPQVSFTPAFAVELSRRLFGDPPSERSPDEAKEPETNDSANNHGSDFFPASEQESIISTPRNKNVVVLQSYDIITPLNQIYSNLIEALKAFGFSVYPVYWRWPLRATVLPDNIRRVSIRYDPDNPNRDLLRLSDISIQVTASTLPHLRSRLITDFREIKRAANLFASFHGGPSGDPLRAPWNSLFVTRVDPLDSPPDEPENIKRTKSYLVCCLVAVAFLYHHGLPGVELNFDELLNECKVQTVTHHFLASRYNSFLESVLHLPHLNFDSYFYKYYPKSGGEDRSFYACKILSNAQVLFANKSLGLTGGCSDTYPGRLTRNGVIVDNIAGRYPNLTWSIPSAGDLGAPRCEDVHWGVPFCLSGNAWWFDWNIALDMLGYTYVRNFASTKDSLGFYRGINNRGYSINRAFFNWWFGDTTQRCIERRWGGLWPNNIHFWTHASFKNFSPFFSDNLLRVNIEAQHCPSTSEYFRVAIAGAENFGFLDGHGYIYDSLAYTYPHIPEGVPGRRSTESHFRFNLRTMQGSLSAREPWFMFRLLKVFYGSGRNQYNWYPVPHIDRNIPAVDNYVNPTNKLFRLGFFIERGNHLRQIEIAPKVRDVVVSDVTGNVPGRRNSVTISFSSALRYVTSGERALKYKVIIPSAVKLRDNGRRIRSGYQYDISRWALVGGRPQFLGHPEGGIKGLRFEFDPEKIAILPRKHWHWDPKKLSRWYGSPEVETNLHWKYYIEIHVEGWAKNIDVPLIGNATRAFARRSLEVTDPLQMKWVWPLAPIGLEFQPRTLQEKLSMLRSPLYVLKNGQAFVSSHVGTDEEVVDELSGGTGVSWSPISAILSRTISNRQDVFILRVPIMPFVSKCYAVDGCQVVQGLSHCQPHECLIRFCGKMMEVDDRTDQLPPRCENVNFIDDSQHTIINSPIEACDLMGASCCPSPRWLSLFAPCGSMFNCEERRGFRSYRELEAFKNSCQRAGKLFYPHCKANGLWTKCCEGDPACEREYRSRLVDGGCCEWLPNGVCRFGPAYKAPVWMDLNSGNYYRCGKLKLCGTTSCGPNTGNLTGNPGGSTGNPGGTTNMNLRNIKATPLPTPPVGIIGNPGGTTGGGSIGNLGGTTGNEGGVSGNPSGSEGNTGSTGTSGSSNIQGVPVIGLPINNRGGISPNLNVSNQANTANSANTANTTNVANTANVANAANTANVANVANTANFANTANVQATNVVAKVESH